MGWKERCISELKPLRSDGPVLALCLLWESVHTAERNEEKFALGNRSKGFSEDHSTCIWCTDSLGGGKPLVPHVQREKAIRMLSRLPEVGLDTPADWLVVGHLSASLATDSQSEYSSRRQDQTSYGPGLAQQCFS
ncbi:UNVERIFIED_CONTAM: hypothetical protein K2H54_048536 [Gekko kuhli]